MQRYKILWADDEIDLLKPHILFLEAKGYEVTTVYSGADALNIIKTEAYDIVFLDENMPGLTGLETLSSIKEMKPNIPVVLITKSEEEYIMEDAIGSKIADYLIKPLNPNQILISLKKILDNQKLISEKTTQSYQQDFRNIGMAFNDDLDEVEWVDIYKKLVYWELEIDSTINKNMKEVLEMQKDEANNNFCKFIKKNYTDWFNTNKKFAPVMSHNLMDKYVFPHVDAQTPLFFIVIDNLRFDQWKTIEPIISQYFAVKNESIYYSILPTTTAYARNAIFSGLMPSEMAEKHPNLWVSDSDEEGQNMHEQDFLEKQIESKKLNIDFTYHKILSNEKGKEILGIAGNLLKKNLNVLVYNFVDMLSHARTDIKMIRELAADESAYRSLTKSWFEHSPLMDLLKFLSEKKCKVIISTDHGTVRVKKATKITGEKEINTNLRYKHGKNLNYQKNEVFSVQKPEAIKLPKEHLSTHFVFAENDTFFAYPNNYNYYVNYYKDTFQHGGISMEEILVPVVLLESK